MSIDQYYLLGNSGLRVSRVALGTMTFGKNGIRSISGNWGSDKDTARAIFDHYVEVGGNFIDTADSYGAGVSESLVGEFVSEKSLRDKVVIATKFSNSLSAGNPNAGGNGRKNIMRAIDDSLKRLRTDYIDLYLLHTWDRMTPVEEVIGTFDDLVRAGKIRYCGLSDVPSWYAARAVTWAEAHALARPICLQLPYSLVERHIEHEYVSMGKALGVGITAWSPLAMGLLSGKYRGNTGVEGRLSLDPSGEGLGLINERNNRIVSELADVAEQMGRSMAQVAINWCVNRQGVASAIVGASRLEQIKGNLAALDFQIPLELSRRLDQASVMDTPLPYLLFSDEYQAGILNTGTSVGDKPEGYARNVFAPTVTDYEFKA